MPQSDEGKNAAAVALGRLGGLKGGKTRAERLTKKARSEIAKKAAAARWDQRKAAAVDRGVFVDVRAVLGRVNRAIKAKGMQVVRTRPHSVQWHQLGAFYIAAPSGRAVRSHVDLDRYARELNVLGSHELMTSSSSRVRSRFLDAEDMERRQREQLEYKSRVHEWIDHQIILVGVPASERELLEGLRYETD
jgi:hypothetical protein